MDQIRGLKSLVAGVTRYETRGGYEFDLVDPILTLKEHAHVQIYTTRTQTPPTETYDILLHGQLYASSASASCYSAGGLLVRVPHPPQAANEFVYIGIKCVDRKRQRA